MRWPVPSVLDASFYALRAAESYSLNDTLLPRDLAIRATEHIGRIDRLACVRDSLSAGSPVAVVALGGSISAGSSYSVRYGGSGAWLYHAKGAQALRSVASSSSSPASLPHLVAHHNGALPATGPAFFEHCVEGQLRFQQPHPNVPRLVLVEFGVNTDGKPAAFERLLRKLLAIRPALALMVVNMHVWTLKGSYRKCWRGPRRSEFNMTEPYQLDEQTWEDRFNFGDEDAIAKMCKHYDVPLVSMRSSLLAAVKANRGRERNRALELRHFMIDCKHPSGQGHTYLAQMVLARLLRDASGGDTVSSPSCGAANFGFLRQQLPPPIHAEGQPYGISQCVNGAQLQTLSGVNARGFDFTGEGRGKLGWVGRHAGDELGFCLVGSGGVGGAVTSSSAWQSGRRLARDSLCVDVGERRGMSRLDAEQYCRRMSSHCGEHTHPKLLKQCPASCGMCPPAPGAESPIAPLTARPNGNAALASSRVVGLWIGYLESYEHMGRAIVSCSGACACAPSEIDAHSAPLPNKPRVSITAVRRVTIRLPDGNASMADGAAGCCKLTLRIQPQSSSGEHKFKLLALLLAHASESDRWQPPGVKVGASWAFDMMHKEHNDRGDEAGVARRPGAKRLLRVPPFVRKASGKAKGKGKAQG